MYALATLSACRFSNCLGKTETWSVFCKKMKEDEINQYVFVTFNLVENMFWPTSFHPCPIGFFSGAVDRGTPVCFVENLQK